MYARPLKIIWNITNRCGYGCKICATYSDRVELTSSEKDCALHSIFSIGTKDIIEIDFAGGDPLFSEDSIRIIHNAIAVLGKERISVTTTGKGIDAAKQMGEDVSKLLYNSEITIDCVDHVSDYLRCDSSYVSANRAAIKNVEKEIENLTINIPILDSSMDSKKIRQLVNEINEISINNISVNLIRLMNVGRMNLNLENNNYSPEHFLRIVRTFIEYAKGTRIGNVHIHCALRGRLLRASCNMLKDKIGVDCSGNVFACAWGGYVKGCNKDNISDNPFYIGNLLENTLQEILVSKRTIDLEKAISDNPTNQCRVYCYRDGDPCSIFKNSDPLFQVVSK